MARSDKVAAVDEIANRFRGASASVVTEYRGLKMTQLIALRRALGTDTTYRVAKNTLVKRAAADAGIEGLESILVGPTAIAFVNGEPSEAAKAIRDFAKDNKGLVVKGGYMDGRALTVAEVASLADLESREVLLAKLAGAIAAPMVQLAGLLEALPRNFAYGLKALIDQQGGVPEAPADEPADAPDAAAEAPANTEAPVEEAPSEEPTGEADTTDDPPVATEAPAQEPTTDDTTTTEE